MSVLTFAGRVDGLKLNNYLPRKEMFTKLIVCVFHMLSIYVQEDMLLVVLVFCFVFLYTDDLRYCRMSDMQIYHRYSDL